MDFRAKAEEVKTHFREKKMYYLVGGAGIVVGAAGMLVASPRAGVTVDSWKLTLLSWKSPTNNIVETIIIRRGHPGNIIQVDQTGERFASLNRTAEVLGIDPSSIRKVLNGKNSHAGGYTFTKLGEAA